MSGNDVNEYNLTTAFDVSTASYVQLSFAVGSQEIYPHGMSFNNNGTKMYITGTTVEMMSMNTVYLLHLIFLQPVM